MYKAIINGREYEVDIQGNKTLVNGKELDVDSVELKKGLFHILWNHQSFTVEIVQVNREEKTVELKINNQTYTVGVKTKYDELLEKIGISEKSSKAGSDLKAPMPGLILNISVSEGQEIKKGEPLLTMEAMKMENIIKASGDGVIKKVMVKKGDKVEKNAILMKLE